MAGKAAEHSRLFEFSLVTSFFQEKESSSVALRIITL